jgi:hypothetical protein
MREISCPQTIHTIKYDQAYYTDLTLVYNPKD